MRLPCWVTKTTYTYSEYAYLLRFHCCNGYAKAHVCYVYTYIGCLIFLTFPAFDVLSILNITFSVCMLETHTRKDIAPIFLHRGTRCKCVVRFTPRVLYPRVQTAGIRWVGGWMAPDCFLMTSRKKSLFSMPRIKPQFLAWLALMQVTPLTALAGLCLRLFNNR